MLKSLYFFGILNLIFRHKTDHLSPCHLGIGSLGDQLVTELLAEGYGDVMIPLCQVFLNAFGLFLGSQIDDNAVLILQRIVKSAAPKGV